MSKVTPRLVKRKNLREIEIYMIFYELVHTQKQFVELAGHFVVRGEVMFLTVQSHPPPQKKKIPNQPIFNDFTACCVCSSTPDPLYTKGEMFFPKAPWQ